MLRSAAALGAVFHITSSPAYNDRILDLSDHSRPGPREPRKADPAKKAKRKAQRDARRISRKK